MTGRRRAIGRPTLRREHLAGGGFALLAAAFALTPTAGQSPAASDAAAPSGGPASSPGTDAAGPLPAWIARGSCEAPEDRLADLTGLVAGGTADRPPERLVYAGRTDLGAALADLGGAGRALLAGGDPAQPERGRVRLAGCARAGRRGPRDRPGAPQPVGVPGHGAAARGRRPGDGRGRPRVTCRAR